MESTLPLVETFRGPIVITLAYVTLYYVLMAWLLVVKVGLSREYRERGEKLDRYFGQDRVLLAADRKVLNTLEQMPPFLVLLWLHAVFVCPVSATIAGGVYLAARLAYPFLVGRELGRSVSMRVYPATFSGYAVLLYLAGGLIWAMV
jgi:hypothetical protein